MALRKTLGLAALVSAMAAQAEPPHLPDLVRDGNRWTITAFDDTSPVHTQLATQGLCFYFAGTVGTHQLYYWVSDTFPDWNGMASQEGDQVFMHGDYDNDVGHDGIEWQVVGASPRNLGAGHWKEWREDGQFGSTIGFGNASLQRVGKCKYDHPYAALDAYRAIGYPKNSAGNEIKLPLGGFEGLDINIAN